MHLLRPTSRRHLAVLALASLAFVACDDDPTEPSTPSTVTAVSGSAITGRVGAQATVTVTVAASNGKALPNQPVTFAVSTGGGSVVPATSTTDANGQATGVWTFGNSLGAQTLTVTSGTVSQTITATVSAGVPASVAVSAGANQTAAAGAAVATAPAVIVRDAANNPVSGVAVQFTSLPGGTVAPQQVTTDASGVARVTSWTLGQQAGTYTLQATVLDPNIRTGNPVSITATATAGAASRVQAAGSFPATAVVGTALSGASLPSVLVTDANGNPVSGATVTFAVTSGGGTLTGAVATTNAQGIATATGFTLGQAVGPNTLTATVAGIGTVNLAVTGTAAAAAQTTIVSGNTQSVRAGLALTVGPSVRVVDRFGNPVPNATVTFSVASGGGSVLGGTQTTNAQGIATVGGWTLGTTPGANTLVARVAGAPDVTFTATGLAGAPAQLIRVSGDAQTVVAFRAAAQPLVVRVVDAGGFPVANTTVTFALGTAGVGSISATTATTDNEGLASTTFTANGVLGVQTVVATVAGLDPVSFAVTTTQNTPASAAAVGATTLQATAGTTLPVNPAVVVRDAAGNPVPGVTVFWDTYGANSGAVQTRITTTNAQGVASPGSWTLSGTPGVNTLAATINAVGIPAILFSATGIAIPAGATITLVPNTTPLTAPPNTTVPVAVQVLDPAGLPLVGVSVQFVVTVGGGSIGGTNVFNTVTDGAGIARVPAWLLGPGNLTVNQLAIQVVNGPGLGVVVTTQ